MSAAVTTLSVGHQAIDPAIGVHPTEISTSLILGADIGTFPNGGLYLWNIDASLQQHINMSHARTVEVAYDIQSTSETVDVVAVTMPDHDEIWLFRPTLVTRTLEAIPNAGDARTSQT